ncbi:MAG: hypothetical protein ACM3KR_08635 [Deltaproteobacteria bacterium]
MNNKSKFWTFIFTMVPGGGHMYLGLLRQGVQLMVSFFMCFFLTDWLRTSVFIVLAPVIWFYSFFDSMNKVNSQEAIEDSDVYFFQWLKSNEGISKNKAKIIGWGMLILGVYLILDRIVINYVIEEYIRVGVVSLILIAAGIKLLIGSKIPQKNEIEGE